MIEVLLFLTALILIGKFWRVMLPVALIGGVIFVAGFVGLSLVSQHAQDRDNAAMQASAQAADAKFEGLSPINRTLANFTGSKEKFCAENPDQAETKYCKSLVPSCSNPARDPTNTCIR